MDYNKEYEKVKESVYFRPEEGIHKITFKDDGLKGVSQFKDGEKPSITFVVDVDGVGKDLPWSMTIPPEGEPIGSASRYGQIVTCGKAWGGLVGKTVTLLVTGTGLQKRYAIQEAKELKKLADNNILNVEKEVIKDK